MSDVPVDMAATTVPSSQSTLDGDVNDLPAHHVAWISIAMVAGTVLALLLV